MSQRQSSTGRDKQKILAAVILLLAIGYYCGRPTLEKWLGQPLPAFGLNADQSAGETGLESSAPADSQDDSREFFTTLGRDGLRSPAGLVYGMGPGGEHRVDHVLLHAVDDPTRPVHSVFDGSREEILETIDQAWRLAQKGGRGVDKKSDGDRTEYTVNMNRVVGYEGGQAGKRKDFPKLRRIRLVLEDENRLVTAYPFR